MTATIALWGSILLNGIGQVMLKRGVGSSETGGGSRFQWWVALLTNVWVWCWGLSFLGATALWLLALSKLDISYAFPLLSVSFVLVAVLSRFLLGERITWKRWLSIAVICLGVVLIAA